MDTTKVEIKLNHISLTILRYFNIPRKKFAWDSESRFICNHMNQRKEKILNGKLNTIDNSIGAETDEIKCK